MSGRHRRLALPIGPGYALAGGGSVLIALLSVAIADAPDYDAFFPTMAACLEEGQNTQLAINQCSGQAMRAMEAERDAQVEKSRSLGHPTELAAAETAWATFRDARCKRLGAAWEGGSGQPMVIHGCRVQVAWDRMRVLHRLTDGRTDPAMPLEPADAALNATWKGLYDGSDKALLDVQRKWLAYRDAHCTWEVAVRGPKDRGSEVRCKAELTVRRVGQLVLEGEP